MQEWRLKFTVASPQSNIPRWAADLTQALRSFLSTFLAFALLEIVVHGTRLSLQEQF